MRILLIADFMKNKNQYNDMAPIELVKLFGFLGLSICLKRYLVSLIAFLIFP